MQERERARAKQIVYLNEIKFLPSLNLTANFAKPNRDLQLIKFKHLYKSYHRRTGNKLMRIGLESDQEKSVCRNEFTINSILQCSRKHKKGTFPFIPQSSEACHFSLTKLDNSLRKVFTHMNLCSLVRTLTLLELGDARLTHFLSNGIGGKSNMDDAWFITFLTCTVTSFKTVAYLGGCIACACTPGGHKGAPNSDQKGRQKEEEEKKRKERKGKKKKREGERGKKKKIERKRRRKGEKGT